MDLDDNLYQDWTNLNVMPSGVANLEESTMASEIPAWPRLTPINISEHDKPTDDSDQSLIDSFDFLWSETPEKSRAYQPLVSAASIGQYDVVKILLQIGKFRNIADERSFDVNVTDKHGYTALLAASQEGYLEICDLLLRNGANASLSHATSDELPLHAAACSGNGELVGNLLQHDPSSIDRQSRTGWTALHCAIRHGQLAACNKLLELKARTDIPRSEMKTHALHLAVFEQNKEIVQAILSTNAEVDALCIDGFSALHIAPQEGDCDVVAMLIKHSCALGIRSTSHGQQALHVSLEEGHWAVSLILLHQMQSCKMSIHEHDFRSKTPLWIVCNQGANEVAHLLIDFGASPAMEIGTDASPNDFLRRSCLHSACFWGLESLVDKILEFEVDINSFDDNGHTPIGYAVVSGNIHIFQTLISKGASVFKHDTGIPTPLMTAIGRRHIDIASSIVECHRQNQVFVDAYTPSGHTPLHIASVNCDEHLVDILLQAGTDPNLPSLTETSGYRAALGFAGYFGHRGTAIRLISARADVNAANQDGYTALMDAAQEGQEELVRLLLLESADYEALWRPKRRVALHQAACSSNTAVLAVILGKDAHNRNMQDSEGITPLILAANEQQQDAVKLLLEAGADVQLTCYEGRNAMHYAALSGSKEIVQALLETKVSLNTLDHRNATTLYCACISGNAAVVELLHDEKNVNIARLESNVHPMHAAAFYGFRDIMRMLLRKAGFIDCSDLEGRTPLYVAAMNGELDVVKFCLLSGARVNGRQGPILQNHAIHAAALGNHVEVIRLLVTAGSSVDCCDTPKHTPFMYAITKGHLEAVKTLIELGADVNHRSSEGQSPMKLVAQKGHVVFMRELIRAQANIQI